MMVLSFNSCNVMIRSVARRSKVPALYSSSFKGPRPIHKEFTVEKATQEKKELLDVASWPTWSTQGSEKYKVGIKSPLKVYDTNELSYIISGKMEIIPQETNIPILVQPGDFVTFPGETTFKIITFIIINIIIIIIIIIIIVVIVVIIIIIIIIIIIFFIIIMINFIIFVIFTALLLLY